MRRVVVYWLPAALWAAIVLSASSDLLSSKHSGIWLSEILRRVGHPLVDPAFHRLHLLIRKCSHLAEYGILGGLLFRALRGDDRGWQWRWAAGAVLIAAGVAAVDEWHQLFVPSRTGNGWDVLLDAAGAAMVQWIARRAAR